MSRRGGAHERDELLEPGRGDERHAGAHRARPGTLRRLAPVVVVLVLAVLAVVAVTAWFSAAG